MTYLYHPNDYLRKHFGKNDESSVMPSLSSIYTNSFNKFLQPSVSPLQRKLIGLESSIRSIFPLEIKRTESVRQRKRNIDSQIKDVYYYSHYILHSPIHSEEECRLKGMSYLCSIYIITYKYSVKGTKNLNEFNQEQLEKNTSLFEKSLFVFPIKGIPYMTSKGTFIINGIERAIVSQLQRSPGIYYARNNLSKASEVKVIPYYGTNLLIEKNIQDKSYVRIGGKRRIPLHIFLLSLGIPHTQLIVLFHNPFKLWKYLDNRYLNLNLKYFKYGVVTKNIRDTISGKIILRKKQVLDSSIFYKICNSSLINSYTNNYFNILAENNFLPEKLLKSQKEKNRNCLIEELIYIYIKLKDPLFYRRKIMESIKSSSLNTKLNTKDITDLLNKLYLDPLYFNLSNHGRLQLNQNLKIFELDHYVLTKVDLLALISYINIRKKVEREEDSVYHIQNRKVRLPGEIFNYLIFRSMLSIKQRKEYSNKDFINSIGAYYVENSLPTFISQRIHALFYPSEYINFDLSLHFLTHYLYHKVYQFSHVGNKLYQFFLLSSKKEIEYFITGSNLSQLLDQVNPLASLTHIRRISLLGPEGLQRENVSMDTRDVQSSFFGRICPIETPEGKSVGIVNSLTLYSKINPYGDIVTPYLKLNNGKVTSTVHFLDTYTESNCYIAFGSEPIDFMNQLSNELIYCKHQGEYKYVKSSQVNYIDISARKILSLSSSLIPFIEHNDGNRALMGSNMQRQAVVNYVRENPISGTGMEILSTIHGSIISNANYSISFIDNKHMILTKEELSRSFKSKSLNNNSKCIDLELINFPYILQSFKKYEKSNQKGYDHNIPINRAYAKIKKGHLLADHAATINQDISIGHNLLVGFTSMNGYSFEDSIVISDRLLKDDLFSSFHTKEFIAFDWDTFQSKERITKTIPYISKKLLTHLDSTGVVRIGTSLKGGDIVIGKILVDRKEKSILSERDKFLQEILAGDGAERDYIKDTSERLPHEMEGTVLDVKKFFFSDTNVPDLLPQKHKERIIISYLNYKYKNQMLKHYVFIKIGKLIFNNILRSKNINILVELIQDLKDGMSSKKNSIHSLITLILFYIYNEDKVHAKKFVMLSKQKKLFSFIEKNNARMLIWNDRKILFYLLQELKVYNTSLYLSIKEIVFTYETLSKKIKYEWYKDNLLLIQKIIYNETPELPIKLVKILIGYKHSLKSGDKMTGRHGNKGVVSQVLPMHEMPYLSDGTPLDIVLNPIGISSRMNLGQVFEVYFGMSSLLLGKKIHTHLHKKSYDSSYQDLRQILYHIYGLHTKESSLISKLSSNEIYQLSKKLSRTMLLSTSSFEGASISDNDDQLDFSNLLHTSQSILIDAKSGEHFDRPITIGLMYILKLNHLVDEKIHARFTGPYNRVTEQPLGGKSLEGGQRFGEMEVWALQAYGAAYTLFDMLTVKSDLKSRLSYIKKDNNVNESLNISKKNGQTAPDFPEAFNVLLREIWCLGLNMIVNN